MNPVPIIIIAAGVVFLFSRRSSASSLMHTRPMPGQGGLYGIDPITGYPYGYPAGRPSTTIAQGSTTNPVGAIIGGITGIAQQLLRPRPTANRDPVPAKPVSGPTATNPLGVPSSDFPAGYNETLLPPDWAIFDNPMLANLPQYLPRDEYPVELDYLPPPPMTMPNTYYFETANMPGFDPTFGGSAESF